MPGKLRPLFLLVFLMTVSISSSSPAQWADGGTPVCEAIYNQQQCAMTEAPNGGAYIVWTDYRQGYLWDIYIQRMARSGHPIWTVDGIPACMADGDQRVPIIISDGVGGAIVIWQDERTGSNGIDLYAQRFDMDGNALWTVDGAIVTGALYDQWILHAVPDWTGGVIIVYTHDTGTDKDVYMQRLRWNGEQAWGTTGIMVDGGSYDQVNSSVLSDGSGGAFIAISEANMTGVFGNYAQRVDTSGTLLWGTGGVKFRAANGYSSNAFMTSDGSGGIILAWIDEREILNHADVYAQRISGDGTVRWTEDGISVNSIDFDKINAVPASDGNGGAFILFTHLPGGDIFQLDCYAQRIDSLGSIQWAEEGVPVAVVGGRQGGYRTVTDGAGGIILTWIDTRIASNLDIYAQKLDQDGNSLWTENGLRVTSAIGYQFATGLISDGEGGAIISWEDNRNAYYDIYAQRLDGDGGIVATTLAHMVSHVNPGSVRLEWILSEETSEAAFTISRISTAGSDWIVLRNTTVSRENGTYSFEDVSVEPGGAYLYRIEIDDRDGSRLLFETEELVVPSVGTALYQNHPNPFNPVTTIRFDLPEKMRTTVTVLNVTGREVVVIADRIMDAGANSITWNGLDDNGRPVGSGVYFYRLRAGKETLTRKMILLR